MPDKRLPIAALALGIIGLFTGGLVGVGSLVGLGLALAGLARARRDPQRYGGRDLAWAAVAANVFGLLSLPPLVALGLALRPMLASDDSLPTPVQQGFTLPADAPPAPPPPPPSSTLVPGSLEASASSTHPVTAEPSPVRVGGGIVPPRKLQIDAVKRWVYTPTTLDGKPVPVIMTVTVNFRLN